VKRVNRSTRSILASTAAVLCLMSTQAHATWWFFKKTSSPGTTEASDKACDGITIADGVIYVKDGKIVGGPHNGSWYKGYLKGTNGDDIILGTDGKDKVNGLGGNDTICTYKGNDIVYGWKGDDTVYTGIGHDRVFGSDGADKIYTGSNDDRIYGQNDNDTLDGGAGNDRIYGSNGEDTIIGGDGHDRLYGQHDDDLIEGGAGNDRIYGSNGEDKLFGGDGHDRLFGQNGNDFLDGGDGHDRLYGGRHDDVCINGPKFYSCEMKSLLVADVVGKQEADGISTLEAQRLVKNNITRVFDPADVGIILSQEPKAGTVLVPHGKFDLVVSKGPEPKDPTSKISIRVDDIETGSGIGGVSVKAVSADGDTSKDVVGTTGGESGLLVLEVTPDNKYVIKFSRSSAPFFADQYQLMTSPPSGTAILPVSMIARDTRQTLNEDTGGTVFGPDGASVTVQANSFDAATGTGDINVTITPVDVSNRTVLAAFPGDFTGVVPASGETPIVPLGTVEFEFTDSNGNELDLVDNATADILIPLYVSTYPDGTTPITVTDPIALWSLDEDTALWTLEGTGFVVASAASPTGLALSATVSHFSWWNCDVAIAPALAAITVTSTDTGTATVTAEAPGLQNWRGTTVQSSPFTVQGSIGPLNVPSNIEVCYSATVDYGANGLMTTPTVCETGAANENVTITLSANDPGPLTTLVTTPDADGGVVNISGNIGTPVRVVNFAPATAETTVTYESAGALPGGLRLIQFNGVFANIAGIPTESGTFTVVVTGTDADDNTSAPITVNYNIDSGPAAPLFRDDLPLDGSGRYTAVQGFNPETSDIDFDGGISFELSRFLAPTSGVVDGAVFDPSIIPNATFTPNPEPVLGAPIGTVPPAFGVPSLWYEGDIVLTGPGGSDRLPIRILERSINIDQ